MAHGEYLPPSERGGGFQIRSEAEGFHIGDLIALRLGSVVHDPHRDAARHRRFYLGDQIVVGEIVNIDQQFACGSVQSGGQKAEGAIGETPA